MGKAVAKKESQTGLAIEMLSIAELSQDPANARKHNPRNIEAIKASLRRFGQQKPIVVDLSGVVRAGNGTLEAARELGWETLAAVRTSLTGSEATAYAIADNRTAELAEWDSGVLEAVLNSLAVDDLDLLLASGFTEEELEKMLADFEPGTEDMQGRIDELDPKMVTCPNCGTEFDSREQV